MTGRAFVVSLLGAESTGKTTLAHDLTAALAARGERAGEVGEYLREFCAGAARTPRQDEQAGIAGEQTRRIEAAAASGPGIVVADTSALMIAVYSEFVFGDLGLYPEAEAAQRRSDLTLLTALDLPWQADGLQRSGDHVRDPVDRLVRTALQRAGVPFVRVAGSGQARVEAALRAIDAARAVHRSVRPAVSAPALRPSRPDPPSG